MGSCFSPYGPRQVESHTNNNYSVGICSMRGCRKEMQDDYCICLSIPNHPRHSIFAVFDGFNGDKAAQYLSKQLVNVLSNLATLENSQLIIETISKMDRDFLKLSDMSACGSTVVFALIKSAFPNDSGMPTQSYLSLQALASDSISSDSSNTFVMDPKPEYDVRIFWVGDSPSFLIDKTECNKLTIDHHWTLPSEKARLTESDTIINGRINGITELSRSFGCNSMKNNTNVTYTEQKQVCIAECKQISAESGQTILLCSDGLTQQWSGQKLAQKYKFHSNQCKDYSKPVQNTVSYLCEDCIDDGSGDNITVIAVQLQ